MALLRGSGVPHGGPFRPLVEALVPAASPAFADLERLAPYRSVLGTLLPGWPLEAKATEWVVDPIVVLGEAVLGLLAVLGEPSRVAVLIDDLQWADPDTVAPLGYLAGRVTATNVLVVAAARDDEPSVALEGLRRHPAARSLTLPRLTPEQVAAVAHDHAASLSPAAITVVVASSNGLPLLVEELAAALDRGDTGREDLAAPPTFADLTRRRLDGLSGLPATS